MSFWRAKVEWKRVRTRVTWEREEREGMDQKNIFLIWPNCSMVCMHEKGMLFGHKRQGRGVVCM